MLLLPSPSSSPEEETADQVESRSVCPQELLKSLVLSFSPRQDDGASEKRKRVTVGKKVGGNYGVLVGLGGNVAGGRYTRDGEMFR